MLSLKKVRFNSAIILFSIVLLCTYLLAQPVNDTPAPPATGPDLTDPVEKPAPETIPPHSAAFQPYIAEINADNVYIRSGPAAIYYPVGKLTRGQELYLETLVQLVQVYEAAHHAIDTAGLGGIAALRQLLADADMNASDLGRLLGVHPSMGSKILKGERSLTVGHLRKLADRFKVRPELFMV